jgi:hypothetical protein
VQWVKGLETLYAHGVRTFVEVGPKRALKGFVDDVLGSKPDVWSLLTNHPKNGEVESFNQALCGLYAAGYGVEGRGAEQSTVLSPQSAVTQAPVVVSQPVPVQVAVKESVTMPQPATDPNHALGQALLQALQQLAGGASPLAARPSQTQFDRNDEPAGSVIVSGTGLGLPGANKSVMDPDNALRILRGEQFVDLIPERFRKEMAGRRITRLVKGDDGSGSFVVIEETDAVIKLAGRGGPFDLEAEYGVPGKLIEALDITTQLAMAAGLDALREAGIPLVQSYRQTSKGTFLPDRWLLPEALRDETGVIFASAFPGGDRFADEFKRYYTWANLQQQIAMLEELRQYADDPSAQREIARKVGELKEELARNPYEFDRRFIFRILAMGHSQFAEYVGARGPNTHVNAACASTAQGVALAEDWIRNGRCRRVIVLGADDVTEREPDGLDRLRLPEHGRRRHRRQGGRGRAALRPPPPRHDPGHGRVRAGRGERRRGARARDARHRRAAQRRDGQQRLPRHATGCQPHLRRDGAAGDGCGKALRPEPLCDGAADWPSSRTRPTHRRAAAVRRRKSLRCARPLAKPPTRSSSANTKGFTGHPMGAGVEDVIAVKILEYGIVPPVPNYKEVDPTWACST